MQEVHEALQNGAADVEQACRWAHKATRHADLSRMALVLEHVLQWRKPELPLVHALDCQWLGSCSCIVVMLLTHVTFSGAKVVIGVSNGAIPAVELAEKLGAVAVWLASGCSAANPEAVQHLECPAVLTVASNESFFGGRDGVVAAAAPFHPAVPPMSSHVRECVCLPSKEQKCFCVVVLPRLPNMLACLRGD